MKPFCVIFTHSTNTCLLCEMRSPHRHTKNRLHQVVPLRFSVAVGVGKKKNIIVSENKREEKAQTTATESKRDGTENQIGRMRQK